MKENELKKIINELYLKEDTKNKIIKRAMEYKNRKERSYMSKKKIGLIAAAAAMFMGIAVYACSGIFMWSSHSYGPSYTELPNDTQMIKAIGYAPNFVEIFENGFTFNSATIEKNNIETENGSQKFESISAEYILSDESINISGYEIKYIEGLEGEKIAQIDGTEIFYSESIHKSVPSGYVLTEADKIAEANGELMIGYGSSEITERKTKYLCWIDDGIYYGMLQFDGTLTAEDMVNMAKEIINK